MPLHRRSLFPKPHGDCYASNESDCSSPPSPPRDLQPTPSPPPSLLPFPCPPIPGLPPSPSPVHGAAGGRRDQGRTHDYGYAGGGTDDHHRRLVTFILIAAAALAFLSLILLGVSVAVRRRQLRRRRQALLAPVPAAAANVEGGWNDDPEGGGGVVHHVWYIRTIGLDEAAIDSIAMTRYRAGAGLLGAADCSVCLGEFQDNELVRLLPKCGHAFHVPCIDTWLRAHVNCPLCRSDVLDPAALGSQSNSNPLADPDANANAAADQVAAASDSILEHEEEENDQEAPHVEEDQHEQLSSPEPLPQQLPFPLPRNVRRAASMDAAIVSAAADVVALVRLPEAAPEEEQSGRRKHRIGAKVSGSGHQSNLSSERPASGGPPRSFFSRHCRARSSVLPL